ncbi:Uncharacterised protein [Salmonella enterica subsp. enterica serovar Bovismorbificans]|uniref:Uncharacterized protein n=1 Tax=Salmonella enterica subsp. enterica serovar Bovismorbificans TaxID=58097 RepID=A0A655CBY3_SALET|nr:Uncharacterised protein [Salmonella enterica subsp. enterica serovar Bovismorbificans]
MHFPGNLVGNRPFIKRIRAVFGNHFQAFRQILLDQLIAFFQRLAVFPENGFAVLMVGDHFAAVSF